MRRPLTPKRIGPLIAVAALAAAALGAGAVIGSGTPSGPGNVPVPQDLALRAGEVPITKIAGKGAPPGRIVYYETTEPLSPIPPGPGGYIFKKCPKGSVGVNGYYYQSFPGETGGEDVGTFVGFGLDDQGSSPAGYRRWAFYWDNVTGEPIDGVTVGIVCDKDG